MRRRIISRTGAAVALSSLRIVRVSFYGDVKHGTSREIAGVFEKWLATPEFSARERMFGFELTYEVPTVYVYCHEAIGPRGAGTLFLFEGTLGDETADPIERLHDLVQLFATADLYCVVDYTPIDIDDDPIGNEVTILP